MNNRGQFSFVALMLGIVIIVLALAFAPSLKYFTESAMNGTTTTAVGLDCANASISDFNKGTCVLVDFSLPYFIIGLIGVAFLVIAAKVVWG